MNPIVTTLVLATTLSTMAALAVIRAFLQAKQGYEDETGFHPGSDTQLHLRASG